MTFFLVIAAIAVILFLPATAATRWPAPDRPPRTATPPASRLDLLALGAQAEPFTPSR